LVLIKYTRRFASVLNPFEISILSDVGHALQSFGEASLPGPAKRLLKNFPMLCFGAPTVSGGAFAQALNQRFIYSANQKISHRCSSR
jgi:hypothetical protein